MPSLDLPSAATAPRCARRDNAVSAFVRMSCEGWLSSVATNPTPHDSKSNRASIRLSPERAHSPGTPNLGREPPVDRAGAAQFLVPISNYNGLPFRPQTNSEKYLWKFVTGATVTSGSNTRALDKPLLAYLYINAVFLYRVRRGWPLGGSAAIFAFEQTATAQCDPATGGGGIHRQPGRIAPPPGASRLRRNPGHALARYSRVAPLQGSERLRGP